MARAWKGDEPPEERAAAAELAGAGAWRDPLVIDLARACLRDAERRACVAVGYTWPIAYLDACLRAEQLLPYVPDADGVDDGTTVGTAVNPPIETTADAASTRRNDGTDTGTSRRQAGARRDPGQVGRRRPHGRAGVESNSRPT